MNEFSLYGAIGNVVMFSFRDLLFEELFEIGVVLSCDISGVEEKRTESTIATFGEETFSFDGSTALVNTAIETKVSNEFFGMIESVDVANVRYEGSGGDGTNAGDGLKEDLRI